LKDGGSSCSVLILTRYPPLGLTEAQKAYNATQFRNFHFRIPWLSAKIDNFSLDLKVIIHKIIERTRRKNDG